MKNYSDVNVYDAFQRRLDYVFQEFPNIYISFSGGKDSGLLLHLVMDYMARKGITRKIGLFHQDMEAQYEKTTEYVTAMYEKFLTRVEPYWFCIPIATRTALSNYQMWWFPWDDTQKDIWVRPMPTMDYVYHLKNNPMTTYKYQMLYTEHAKQFGRWYKDSHGGGKTIGLIGLRTDESLHRYSGIINKRNDYKGEKWITEHMSNVWSASPLYDFDVYDVWLANHRFGYEYNSIYDLFFMAGVELSDMRVASPFNDEAKTSLNLYRVLEPATWAKLLGRVQGVNFAAIYAKTKAMGYKDITLPPPHTWESYTKFLLATLPDEIRKQYEQKFAFSTLYWSKTGGGLPEETIQEIEASGFKVKRNGKSNYTKEGKTRITFDIIPDHTDKVTKNRKDVPSWKRNCLCILRNDHLCKGMGFGLTKFQQMEKSALIKKYNDEL
jgi:predicted phosphoadenosine phosphosulfate sulfurtransferase